MFFCDIQDESMCLTQILLPSDIITLVVGQNHCTLLEIVRLCGCIIKFEASVTDETKAVIKGPVTAVIRGILLLCRIYEEFCNSIGAQRMRLNLLIPPDSVGAVIGKGGNGLRIIREASMCLLDVARENDSFIDSRRVTIRADRAIKVSCAYI